MNAPETEQNFNDGILLPKPADDETITGAELLNYTKIFLDDAKHWISMAECVDEESENHFQYLVNAARSSEAVIGLLELCGVRRITRWDRLKNRIRNFFSKEAR